MSDRKQSPEVWAAQVLLHAHSIASCPDHGFMPLTVDRTSLDYAHALAAAAQAARSAEIPGEYLEVSGTNAWPVRPDSFYSI